MNKDRYNEVINGKDTYIEIANTLNRGKNVIIGWTDEEYTHLNILFSLSAYKEEGNLLQGGLRGGELFVSIMKIGAFGFNIDDSKSSRYIAEKMSIHGQPTTDKLAELINGIIKEIRASL